MATKGSDATPDPIVIAAYLDDAASDLDAAARLIVDPPNRLAAFHLQQSAEKLTKAVRLHRGLFATADHQIASLVVELPSDDPWRAKLLALGPLSSFATSYRYPSPAGKLKPAPAAKDLQVWIDTIAALIVEARADLLRSR